MPLLAGSGSRFSAFKIDQRKKQGQALPANASQMPQEVEMSLGGPGGLTVAFNDGQWTSSGGIGSMSSGSAKREALRKLEEENNLLKAKLEILMDMLTESTAQSRLQAKEVKMLRAKLRK